MISRDGLSQSGIARPVRVALFTDTLGDVNGVSRFLNDIADESLGRGRSLHILTSTRFAVRDLPNLHNIRPRAAIKLPGYPDLEFVLPPVRRLCSAARALRPDAIHISTPGPVGFVGRMVAARLGVPLAGVYHTDFPAYVEHLFDDDALTSLSRVAMRRFYRPFDCVFARSSEYGDSLGRLGIESHRRVRLRPGFNTSRFHPRFRDEKCWASYGVPSSGVKVLYVGRVSVEKNLPLLTNVWRRVRTLSPRSDAQLIVVGDGPYRATMESELSGCGAHFLGFRHGEELSRLYASSDLFVFPSTTDTLGQVVLECQASGLPVLVTNVGGPKEVVAHGAGGHETGLVLPPDEPGSWARQIVHLCADDNLRQTMGHAAHLHSQQFSIRDSFEHFWQSHERLVHGALPTVQIEPRPRIGNATPSASELDSLPA